MHLQNIATLDIVVIIGYFLIVFAVAAYVIIKKNREKTQGVLANSENYFLSGRNEGWFVIGASLFASNIGSEHLIGLAGAGASGSFPASQFELLACFILLILGWVFVPFYLKSGVYTMPEFLEKRYNSVARNYLSWISIFAYVVTKISVTIAAGAIVITSLLGLDFWLGAFIIVIATGIYTILGGLRAVIYTDMMQMFVLIAGSLAVTFFGLLKLGGWDVLVANVGESHLNLWRPMSDPDFPWTGILFGAPIIGVWYWCTDQFIVQRVLAARNITNARRGTIFASYLKLLPLFLFLIPGVIAYALSIGENPVIHFPVDAATGKINYDAALPNLVVNILPVGFKGLVISGLLAALMSSLSAVFNSCSTLITFDIYKKIKPHASDKHLVRVGQISTVFLVALGIAWIPLMKFIEGGLFKYLQSVQAYISPPIAAVFFLGIFFKKLNSKGAMASLFTGAFLGLSRLTLEIYKSNLDPNSFLYKYADINFLHFALFLFVICCAVLIVVSMNGKSKPESELKNITYEKRKGEKLNILDIGLSAFVVIFVMLLWIYFS